jgi:putative ABC transport system permease protein
MRLSLPAAKYSPNHPESAFYRAVLDKVDAYPQVQASGLDSLLPIQSAGMDQFFLIEGRPELPLSQILQWPDAEARAVSPGFFPTLHIPLVRGRYFTDHDDADGPGVLLINEDLADRFFPNEDPIGRRLRLPGMSEKWLPIVGVVGNTKQFGLSEPVRPEIDVSYLQAPLFAPMVRTYLVQTMSLAVRTAGDPIAVANAVREAVRGVDPEQPVYDIETMQQVIASSVAGRRFDMFLLVAFAVVALALAALGIYGVISYGVRQRTHEIGIRVALGARQRDVLKMIVGSGMRMALIGVSIGVVGALALSRFLSSLLYGVKPTDLFTFVTVTSVLLGVALLACYIPARRATKIDPIVALRHE